MRRPRPVLVVGAAVPVVLLVTVGFWAAGAREATPEDDTGVTAADRTPVSGIPASAGEAAAVRILDRAVASEQDAGFSGTQLITAWYPGGATSRVFLVRQAGGTREVTAVDTASDPASDPAGSPVDQRVDDGLRGPSGIALKALVDGYDLSRSGDGQVAGRDATVVSALRSGRERARFWVDDRTGVLLRQDVLDDRGRLERMAAFTDFASPAEAPAAGRPAAGTAQVTAWRDAVPMAALDGWRSQGWTCPQRLPGGYVLLDARQSRTGTGGPMLHLTYGDGLSAVSLFMQHGSLGGEVPAGWRVQPWGRGQVREQDGFPEIMVWQGAGTVFTAVGDAGAADLRATLAALPRQRVDAGALAQVRHAVSAMTAWLPG